MTKHEIYPPGQKRYTDRELLQSCLDAMRVAQDQTIPTDWRHMIEALDTHLASEPRAECVHEDHEARLLIDETCARWCRRCGAFSEFADGSWTFPQNRGPIS